MRPGPRLLSDGLIANVVAEARGLVCTLGVEIHNTAVAAMLCDHGAAAGGADGRIRLTESLIDQALRTVPGSFRLFDALGNPTCDFSGDDVYFTPGSAAIQILDGASGEMRPPTTADYVRYVKLTSGLAHIASQSTALIPADVQERIADSHRLDLSLLYGEKPVVTGAFTIDGFEVMRDLQLAVRGSAEALRQKPLCVFSCCPTAPLKWSAATSQNLVDCARWSIPVEFVSMPLSGFVAPVTLAGSLIQKTAETLSGVVISQLANPGHPVLYGGSPAIFDIRYETTPMGAMLAALSGINRISGPGMLDFESCQSLEKLVVDNEICGMTYRLLEGIQPREDFPALPILQELLREKHLLIADQTRRYLRREISYRGPTIDRGCPTAARPN